QHAHGDPLLAGGRELPPVARYRGVEIEQAAVGEQVRAERGHRLRGREHVDDRVALPESPAGGVDVTAPEVDDHQAGDRGRERRPDLATGREAGGERITYRREPGIALAVDHWHRRAAHSPRTFTTTRFFRRPSNSA